jgi:F0F1-type ATP synthase delta subunit
MEEIFKNLTQKITTKEDLVFFLDQINKIENFIFKDTEIPLSQRIKGKVNEELRSQIQKLESEGLISGPTEQISFFRELKNFLKKLPEVKLEIAFEPSREFVFKLGEWFKRELGKKVILNLISNPEIIGGAIIEYQGKYLDLSLVKEIKSNYGRL